MKLGVRESVASGQVRSTAQEPKSRFYIFNGWKSKKKTKMSQYRNVLTKFKVLQEVRESPRMLSNVPWEHHHACLFLFVCRGYCVKAAELNNCNKDSLMCAPKELTLCYL